MSELIRVLKEEVDTEEYEWLLTRIEPVLHNFQSETHNLSSSFNEITASTIPELLGIGTGSTPQSDDIFLGIITTIKCKKPSISELLYDLATMKFERYTTKKSASLIRGFLRGNFPDEIKDFMEILRPETAAFSHINKFKLEIQNIKMIGASSGHSFLVGVLWQLRYYENQKKNLIVKD